MFFYCVGTFEVLKTTFFIELYLKLYILNLTSGVLWRPLDREEGLVATRWLYSTHTKCAHCRDKGVGQDDCVLKKDCSIYNSLTAEQKLQLATPTYKARKEKELQKKATSPSLVDPSTVTVVGKVESDKGDSGDRGETPKKKKTSHKSPKKTSKPPKAPDFQSGLKNLDEKWSERFTRLEALFLSKTLDEKWSERFTRLEALFLSKNGGTGSELKRGGV